MSELSKIWLIDAPECFASLGEWTEFLAEMRQIEASEPHPQIRAAIEEAKRAIAELETVGGNPLRRRV